MMGRSSFEDNPVLVASKGNLHFGKGKTALSLFFWGGREPKRDESTWNLAHRNPFGSHPG